MLLQMKLVILNSAKMEANNLNMQPKHSLILIVGPTAVGKTELALQLACELNERTFLKVYNWLEYGHFYRDKNKSKNYHP